MRKIVLDLAVTLDGFIEGPNGEIDWCIMDSEMNFDAFLADIDVIFYGRVSYDAWGNFQPGPEVSESEKSLWSGVHSKKKYVFSNTLREDNNATFIGLDWQSRVEEIRNQSGGDIWLYGGAKLIKSFIDHGLVDVYRLSIHPTVLGSGKPLFESRAERLTLNLVDVKKFRSGVVQVIYHTPARG